MTFKVNVHVHKLHDYDTYIDIYCLYSYEEESRIQLYVSCSVQRANGVCC